MDEKALFKLSLMCTVLGIACIFFISETISSGKVSISDMDGSMVGSKVNVIGMVVGVTEKPSLFLVELEDDNRSIAVVWFKGGGSFLNKAEYNMSNFIVGSEIEAVGKVQEWHGKLEIIAEELRFK